MLAARRGGARRCRARSRRSCTRPSSSCDTDVCADVEEAVAALARAARGGRPHRARRTASPSRRPARIRRAPLDVAPASCRRSATSQMVERVGRAARRQGVNGLHVHVGVRERRPLLRAARGGAAVAAGRARALGELAVRRRRADGHALEPRRHPRRAAARRRAAGLRRLRRLGGVGRAARRARRDRGSHAHLVGHPPAPALRHARDPHRRPADVARAHGAPRRAAARRSSRTRRRARRPTAATICRTAGRAARCGLDAELVHPDGDRVVSARELARELLGARAARARGVRAARAPTILPRTSWRGR